MKLGIVGSRDFTDYTIAKAVICQYPATNIVSGGASGADSLGKQYAEEKGWVPIIHEAEWDNLDAEPCDVKYNRWGKPYNRLAGHNRNTLIVRDSDLVVAFWDGKSPGTRNTITKCRNLGVDVHVYNFKGERTT